MPKKGANISLSSYDDIFETDASRAEAKQERIQSISILDLVPFENHPFKVVDDEAMLRTTESIAQYGVLTPIIARPLEDGGYEIISGHRRVHAAEAAGLAVFFVKMSGVFFVPRKEDAMNVFEAVKQNLTTRQAAEMYGIQVSRHGMAVCPFHNDKNPSMKVDKRFHCFACQADGDAVDFVSRLFGLPSREAAVKLADDFGISYDNRQKHRTKPHIREPTPEQRYQQEENRPYCNGYHSF